MSAIINMVIGKRLSPDDLIKKWRSEIRSQQRNLDKSIRQIDTETTKTKKLIKDAVKRGDEKSMRILAKEVVRSGKVRERMVVSKAQLNSLLMSMQEQLGIIKVTGALEKSSHVMSLVNKMIKLPEIANVMREMSQEMMKAGIIEEMVDDALEMDDDGVEEEAEDEVNKVIQEITSGLLGQAGKVGADLPAAQEPEAKEQDKMEARLTALKAI